MILRPLIEYGELVAHVYRDLRDVLPPMLEGTGRILVGSTYHAGTEVVDLPGIPQERIEQDIADHRNIQHHPHGLRPEIIHIHHKRNPLLPGKLRRHKGHVVGRDLTVDQIIIPILLQHLLQVFRRDMVAPDPAKINILLITRLHEIQLLPQDMQTESGMQCDLSFCISTVSSAYDYLHHDNSGLPSPSPGHWHDGRLK